MPVWQAYRIAPKPASCNLFIMNKLEKASQSRRDYDIITL